MNIDNAEFYPPGTQKAAREIKNFMYFMDGYRLALSHGRMKRHVDETELLRYMINTEVKNEIEQIRN